jgi:alpha-beta hydrolase superfamily lysophospholipase
MAPANTVSCPGAPRLRPMRWSTLMLTVALLAVAAWLALLAALWFGQEKLLFHPAPLAADTPLAGSPDVHEVWVDVPGARLNALHLRLPNPDGVVFFLHGNAGNLQSWFVSAEFYRALNLDLFMIDYRGYGKSSGRIESEAQLHADVRAAWSSIEPTYRGKRRVIYGRSLGTGLAASLAAELQPELTVLVSPYFSMQSLAFEHYRWVPQALLRYPLRTDLAIPRIKTPVFLAHGERDTLIVPEHSRRLKALSPQARLVVVPDAAHNDIHQFEAYLAPLRAAMTSPGTVLASQGSASK